MSYQFSYENELGFLNMFWMIIDDELAIFFLRFKMTHL